MNAFGFRFQEEPASPVGNLMYPAADGTAITNLPKAGYIYGLALSNNGTDPTNDIDIAVGFAAADASPYFVMENTVAALTKRLDAAWSVGDGNGGRDTGSIADGTWHVFLIRRSDTGVVDALFSQSATSPTMPANYDQKRRIGSIIRASGAILPNPTSGEPLPRDRGGTGATSNEASHTIASGSITITALGNPLVVTVDTEAGAATDDLDDIQGGFVGQMIVLRTANNARDVTLIDGSGSLRLTANFTLDNATDCITLIKRDGTNWMEVSRANIA